MDLDIDHLRGWIGNSETMSERLTLQLVERFNANFAQFEAGVAESVREAAPASREIVS